MPKRIKVGEVFRAQMVRKGETSRGTYHFVKINLNEDDTNKSKENVTLQPQKGAVEEGHQFKITALHEFWISHSKYKDKWYHDPTFTCDIEEVGTPPITVPGMELPDGDLPF